jgi:CRP-like cAMP-binding protein
MGFLPSICSAVNSDPSPFPCLGHIKQLTSCGTVREIPPQHVILSQGEAMHTVNFICEGIVKVTHTTHDGKRVILALRRGGWILGIAAIMMRIPYPNTAETVTRTRICTFPTEEFRRSMKTNPALTLWVAGLLASGFYSSIIAVSEKSLLSGRERLEKLLWEMAEPLAGRNGKKEIKLPILLKQWEVAQLLSLTPQHLARLILQMEKEGVVERKKGWLILPDLDRLYRPGTNPLLVPQGE